MYPRQIADDGRKYGYAVRQLPDVSSARRDTNDYNRTESYRNQFEQRPPAAYDNANYRSQSDRGRSSATSLGRVSKLDEDAERTRREDNERAQRRDEDAERMRRLPSERDNEKEWQLPRTYEEYEKRYAIDHENGVSLASSESSGDEEETEIQKRNNRRTPRTTVQTNAEKADRVQRFSEAADMVLKLIDTVLGSAVWGADELNDEADDYRQSSICGKEKKVYGDKRRDAEKTRQDDYNANVRAVNRPSDGFRRGDEPKRISALEEAKYKYTGVAVDDRKAADNRQYERSSDGRDRKSYDDYGRQSRDGDRSNARSIDPDDDLRLDRSDSRANLQSEKLSRLLKTMTNSGWFQGYGVVVADMQQRLWMRGEREENSRAGVIDQRQSWETQAENTWRTLRANKKSRRNPDIKKLDPGADESNHFRRGMSRELAVEVLRRSELGSFIIRDCTVEHGCFALSIKILPARKSLAVAHYLVYQTPIGAVGIKDYPDREWTSMKSLIRNLDDLPADGDFCQFLGIPISELRYARQGDKFNAEFIA